MKAGVVGRDGCTMTVGPHKSKDHVQRRRRSRVSRAGCTHAQQVDKCRLQNTGYSHGDRPLWQSQTFITPVTSVRSHVRGTSLTDNFDAQFPVPQRGRKRLSREATLHTELALEWPELVQIGRCKVQWLPRTANKRILTSFC